MKSIFRVAAAAVALSACMPAFAVVTVGVSVTAPVPPVVAVVPPPPVVVAPPPRVYVPPPVVVGGYYAYGHPYWHPYWHPYRHPYWHRCCWR